MLAQLAVGGRERVGVRKADLADDVPVPSSGRERERAARAVPVEAALRVERVEQRQQVVLVGAAAVVEDEQPLRISAGRSC